jgi:chemotaxis protein methyltransferase CheR
MLAMLMQEHFSRDLNGWSAGVLATDISTRVLETARAGVYPEEKIQFLPKPYLNQYFTAAPGPVWSVLPRIKNQVVFRRFNLMTLRFPFRHPFDIIFCRNVMIYFDDPTRRALVEQFYRWLRPGGYLFIGHSESIRWDQRELEYCMPSVYRKRGA